MYDVIALGELLIDFTPAGESQNGNIQFERNPGGAPANVLAALAKLNMKTAFIGKVGNDPFGMFLNEVLHNIHIDTTGLVFSEETNTTLAFVHLDRSGDRSFSFYRNPGADMMLKEEEINFKLIENSKIFHFGSISMTHEPCASATLKAIKFAKDLGILISYDPNLRVSLWQDLSHAKKMILLGLAFADIVKISEEELEFITGIKDLEEGSKYIYDLYQTKLITVTLGPDGSFYRRGNDFGKRPGRKVNTVDTTGAGDAFFGGFLYQILKSEQAIADLSVNKLEQMVDFANVVGAFATTKHGAIPAMPELIDIQHFIDNDGLLAYWALDEGQGKQAKERISGSYDPIDYVFNNALFKPDSDPLWGKGVCNHALLFDGYSTWITHSSNLFNKPINALTIEAWVAPRSYEWAYDDRLAAIVNQHDREAKQGFILGLYRHGVWSLQVGINGNWVEVWAEHDPLPKGKWSHIAATFDNDLGKLSLHLNGRKIISNEIPQNSTITPANEPLIIGKNNQATKINEAFSANMFNGMIDEVKIYNQALSQQDIRTKYQLCLNAWSGELPVPDLEMKRSRFKGDRHRPQYHFIAPGHWMNEPHAPLYFNGQYHLFFQHNPQGPYFNHIHWGHVVSDDLVRWRDLPFALFPEADKVDPFGDWSGCAVVDNSGNPTLIYTAGDDSKRPNSMAALAGSTFLQDGDNDLKQWVKYDHPITVQEKGLETSSGEVWFGQFRDPFVWKEENTWYQIIGSGIMNGSDHVGGTALLYTSTDLINWTYRKPLCVGDSIKYPKTGYVWELPVFLPLGRNKEGEVKHILLINPWYGEYSPHFIKYVWYWIGTWDKKNYSFIPDQEEPELTDVGEHFTGPSGMIDPNGRLLIFSIAQGKRTAQDEYDSGWAHNGGLPIQIFLREDGRLGIEPVAELRSLRRNCLVSINSDLSFNEANQILTKVTGDNLEIELEVDCGKANEHGIAVRRSPEGAEQTVLYYNKTTQELLVNRNHSSLAGDVEKGIQGGFVDLKEENLKLRVYIDRSMIEAYANGLKGLTTRVYPTKDDALGLQLWGSELTQTMTVKSLHVWTLDSAYD